MSKPIRYDAMLAIRAAPDVIAEIHEIAKLRNTKPSEWIRQAISLALQIERGTTQDTRSAK